MAPTQIDVRDLTDEEVRFFGENGWLYIPQLISEDDAGLALAELQRVMGPDASTLRHPAPSPGTLGFFNVYAPLSIERDTGEVHNEFFYGLSHSSGIGRLGARLAGGPVRYWVDQSLVKMPSTSDAGGEMTQWHADNFGSWESSPFRPVEGQMQLWMALRPVPPERGSMRFIPARELTDEIRAICAGQDVEASYPPLEDLGVISPPLSMRAGDATIHSSTVFHSAPRNLTDEPRWAYIVSMFPADTTFSGAYQWPCENVPGVKTGEPFPDARFPVLAQ